MQLIVIKNQKQLYSVPLRMGINTIGRAKNKDVVLEDPNVTRHHAVIQADVDERIFLFQDMGSLNGSYINNIKTSRKLLKQGDMIHMGTHHLLFTHSQP